jgi:hypothetical protein
MVLDMGHPVREIPVAQRLRADVFTVIEDGHTISNPREDVFTALDIRADANRVGGVIGVFTIVRYVVCWPNTGVGVRDRRRFGQYIFTPVDDKDYSLYNGRLSHVGHDSLARGWSSSPGRATILIPTALVVGCEYSMNLLFFVVWYLQPKDPYLIG